MESDWRDLITASIEEHLVAVKHPEELWFVNTCFFCLCTRGMPYSFVLEFCILSERKAYRLPDRPFGDRNARRNSGASRQVDHVII